MNTSPLSKLASAEQALVATIDAVTNRIDAIGTGAVEEALIRLQVSALAAQDRLVSAYSRVQRIAADVLEHLGSMTGMLTEQLASLPTPVKPAVKPAPAPIVAAPPVLPVPAATSTTCPTCGFLPRKGATVCCGVAFPAPIAPVAETETAEQTMARVLLSRERSPVPAEDVANSSTPFSPDGAPAPSKPRSRKGKAAAAANGVAT